MKTSSLTAILMLLGMFFLMFFSSVNDSATFDEVAHIGAGFSYLKEFDGRLNPEHPPLIKSLSALPLLFLSANDGLNFDTNQSFWTLENVNDRQWAAGNNLLYESGNNAGKILIFSRLPIMFLGILFGWILFWWTRKNYSASPAILTLLLYALSPTFLAHSRYVTTDLGAAFAFFLSIIFFINFLEKNNKKSIIYFGLIIGLSLLVKFSLVILLPFFGAIVIINAFRPHPPNHPLLTKKRGERRELITLFWVVRFIEKFAIACFIALVTIYLFYIPQIWNYSTEQNLADAKFTIGGYKTAEFAPKIDFWLLKNKITQPLGQYLHGFLMAAQRTAGGNSAYFLGEVNNKGWIHYFPTLFITKKQIGFYVLILLALLNPLLLPLRKGEKSEKVFLLPLTKGEGGQRGLGVKWIFIIFILYYWAWSLWSPLNIGIRHILPTFPFIYILVSKSILEWANKNNIKKFFLGAIFIWMAVEIASVFPYFLSYYNQFAGGWRTGYKIATDSNYDWGQDLKRLKKWTEENNIEKIYLDYFGGGSPKYYFGNKYEFWRHEKGPPPAGSYFAISANSLVGAENLYYWLKNKKPIDRAGSSIFIFSF